jgi:uncharacterized protein YjiS (DUF1127 family)
MQFSHLVWCASQVYLPPRKRSLNPVFKETKMAAFDTSRPFAAAGSASRFGAFFVNIVSAVAAWNDARLTRNSLAQLSDRELDDIGLVRGDIDDVARRF